MTLDKKLEAVAQWDRSTALECWMRYESLYTDKHGGALHQAMIGGSLDKYIDRECRTFARYARMFIYQRSKPKAALVDYTMPASLNNPHRFP